MSQWAVKVDEDFVGKNIFDHRQTVTIDHKLFRVHYQMSVYIILFSVMLCAVITYKGIPNQISCIFPANTDFAEKDSRDLFCWTFAVYTLTNNLDNEKGAIAPGVRGLHDAEESVRYHYYYHWIPFILLIQIILFSTPRYFWRCFENGKIKMITSDLKECILEPEQKSKKIKMIAEYFVACLNYNSGYGFAFAFCELLNLTFVISQIYFLDAITGYVFSSYGPEVIKFSMEMPNKRVDPLVKAFPTIGHCTINIHGPSGNTVPHSGICALPYNITSERYFLFMWFYLTILAIMDIVNIIYRLTIVCSRNLRESVLCTVAYCAPKKIIQLILKECQYGDWFILHLIGKNLDGPIFRELLEQIKIQLQENKSNV